LQPKHDGRALFREDQFQAFLRKCRFVWQQAKKRPPTFLSAAG